MVPAQATLWEILNTKAPFGLTTVPNKIGVTAVVPEVVLNQSLAVSMLVVGLVVPVVLKRRRLIFAGAEPLRELRVSAGAIITASRVPGFTVAVFCVTVAV